jgi:ketosteroid isomerase-like protein
MSQENVDAVRALFVAFADRDLDAAARVLDPKVEIRPAIVGGPEGIVYRGLPGNGEFWADIDATWAEFRIEPEEFRDLGERVLVLGRAFARGRESGVAVNEPAAWIAELHEAKIVGFWSFSSRAEALKAAGLRE